MRFLYTFFLLFCSVFAHPLASSAYNQNSYIVVFQDSASIPNDIVDSLERQIQKLGATINYHYTSLIKGFAITIDSDKVDQLRSLNNKAYPFVIEKDKKVDGY